MDGTAGSLVWRPPPIASFLRSQIPVVHDNSRAAGSTRLTPGEQRFPPRTSAKARAAGLKEDSAQRADRRAALEHRQPTTRVGDLTVCEQRSITPATLNRYRTCYAGYRDWLTTTLHVVSAREGDPDSILAEYFDYLYEVGRPVSDARGTLHGYIFIHSLPKKRDTLYRELVEHWWASLAANPLMFAILPPWRPS